LVLGLQRHIRIACSSEFDRGRIQEECRANADNSTIPRD
jgi:hypothetical protein